MLTVNDMQSSPDPNKYFFYYVLFFFYFRPTMSLDRCVLTESQCWSRHHFICQNFFNHMPLAKVMRKITVQYYIHVEHVPYLLRIYKYVINVSFNQLLLPYQFLPKLLYQNPFWKCARPRSAFFAVFSPFLSCKLRWIFVSSFLHHNSICRFTF